MKQLNFKIDSLTLKFLVELEKELHGAESNKKSEVIRTSISTLAKQVLGEERVKELLLEEIDI